MLSKKRFSMVNVTTTTTQWQDIQQIFRKILRRIPQQNVMVLVFKLLLIKQNHYSDIENKISEKTFPYRQNKLQTK